MDNSALITQELNGCGREQWRPTQRQAHMSLSAEYTKLMRCPHCYSASSSSATSCTCIQLYARGEWDIYSVIHFTGIYREDIRMSFKWDKCGQMFRKTVKAIWADGVELPEDRKTDIHNAKWSPDKDVQRSATTKYLQSIRQVLRRQLNARNTIHIPPAGRQIPS